jgi:type I restriction enzyme S subunit
VSIQAFFLFLRFLRNIRGTEFFEIRSASNIVNYNWIAFLKFQKVKKLCKDVLEKFNVRVEPIYKQINILGNQNQYLKEARHILLPRLVTGMINVSEIDKELSLAAEDEIGIN